MLAIFCGVEFWKTVWKFRKRKIKLFSCVHDLRKTWNYAFSRRSRAVTTKRNVQQSVMHVQSCCFANPNLLLFCRSRWRRRRRCLSSPVANLTITSLRDRGHLFVPGYVPRVSHNPYPNIVHSVTIYKPHISHFWIKVIFASQTVYACAL